MSTPLALLAEALLACRAFRVRCGGSTGGDHLVRFRCRICPILPTLRARLPHLLAFGDYDAVHAGLAPHFGSAPLPRDRFGN